MSRLTPIDARDVAAAAARVLIEDGHEGQAYVLTGPEALGYEDMARAYTRALGREVRWVEVNLEQATESMTDAGLPRELAEGYAEVMARYRDGGVTGRVSPHTAELLSHQPRTFETFVRDHRVAFTTNRKEDA